MGIGAGFVALILFRRDLHTVSEMAYLAFITLNMILEYRYQPYLVIRFADHVFHWHHMQWMLQQNSQTLDPGAATRRSCAY